jgi:hypothetical protein
MKTKKNKKAKKNETLFGRTDYAVREVNSLILGGAIPEEFIEFHPESGLKIDYFITSFMEHFPKKELGNNWMEVFEISIQYGCHLIKCDIAPRQDIREFDDGIIRISFRDTSRLSDELSMSKSELDKLLQWVIQRNPDLQPLVMHVGEAGYMVSSFLLYRLERSGVRLDQYLKDMASGKVKFEVNQVG